ncbi:MAG: AAA family ATPase [Candidatus Thioglobus sp.]|uniref:AAA family ATPase n=1 Tax=Candidatus Thioglobus sp. TaxID=2026721 RepID=UPI0026356B81|nr:AAA family ATPase [Candidatus Thioglobus sp.]MDC9727652.1 AAA family ATPase [Candidatus Thioglobus sp.]
MDNLSRIKIKGFKSIKELDLEMKPINVLIGANGSGKSNFVSIFRLLENIHNKRLQKYLINGGGADGFLHFGKKVTDKVSLYVKIKNNEYYAELSKNDENDTLVITDSAGFYSTLSDVNYNPSISYDSFESGISESDKPIVVHSRDYLKQCKLYHFHDSSPSAKFKSYQDIGANQSLSSFAENLAPFLYRLRDEFNVDYQNIVSAVQTVAPYFQDFDFNIKGDNILLRWQHVNDLSNRGFSAQSLSDGTARFICMATLFLQPKDMRPKTIVLDEPEIGLHPAALAVLSEIIQAIANDGSQVIISTQSVELANYFEPDDFVVVDYENGESKFKRLNKKDLGNWIESYRVGEAWSEGLLGGEPKW